MAATGERARLKEAPRPMKTKTSIKPSVFICALGLSACAGTGAVVEYYPAAHSQTSAIAKIDSEISHVV